MKSDFYVYILFDPDTSQPFYVGKGKGDRWRKHYQINRKGNSNWQKTAIVKRAIKSNKEIPCIKFAENLTEKQSFDLERILISSLGRRQFGGLLTNRTDGGDGESGKVYTEATLKKMRAAKLGKKLSNGHKKNISKSLLSMSNQLSESHKRRFKENPELRKSCGVYARDPKWIEEHGYKFASSGHRNKPHSEEARAKISAKLKGRPWSEKRRAAQKSLSTI